MTPATGSTLERRLVEANHVATFALAGAAVVAAVILGAQLIGHWLAPGSPVGIGISQRDGIAILRESGGFPSRLSEQEKAEVMARYEGVPFGGYDVEMYARDLDLAAYYGKAVANAYERAQLVMLIVSMGLVAPWLTRLGYRPRDALLLAVPLLNISFGKRWLWRITDPRWRAGQGEKETPLVEYGTFLLAIAIIVGVSHVVGQFDLVRVGR